MRLYGNQFQWFGDNVNLGALVQDTRLLLDIKTDGTIRFRNQGTGLTRYSKTGQNLSGANTSGVPLCLFGYTDAQGSGRRCTARLFRCCMATNGIPVRDFIPVKRVSDSKAGLYDMVSEAFFTDESSAGVAFNVGDSVPAEAWWTGGVNADIASPENWTCKDANGDVMAGVLPGGFTLPAGEGVCDMTGGFAFEFASGITIDANGRTLKLPNDMVGGTKAFTVTSSVAGGELIVEVARGATLSNTAMALTGALKLVKTGAGTFIGAKSGQSYTGGTVINAGLVKSGVGVTPWGAAKALVTVADTGAAFDWNAMVSTSATPYNFNIKGTGINGGGAIVFTPASASVATYAALCLADLELSGDALMRDPCGNANVYCGFIKGGPHTLTLNGYTLTIDAGAKFNFCRLQATDTGTIVFMTTQSGLANNRLASFWDPPIDLSGVTFDMGANCVLNDDTNNRSDYLVLGTFIDRRTGAEASYGNKGMTILNRFQPMTTNLLQKAVLGDATHLSPILDMSALNGPLVLPDATYTLSAADGATVYVKLGDRSVKSSEPLITWTTKPADIDGIKFAAYDRGGSVKVADDGVYLLTGLLIIVK